MIGRPEIDARARRLGLLPGHVAKDYALNHVLAAIAEMGSQLVFRGGTALARIYWSDFRLSEDLDFILDIAPPKGELERMLSEAVRVAAKRTGLSLELRFVTPRDGWTRSTVVWPDGELLLDVNLGEKASLVAESRQLDLPYSDLADAAREIRAVGVAEILGNKWYMLDDREEPRDLYDLWAGVCRYDTPFEIWNPNQGP